MYMYMHMYMGSHLDEESRLAQQPLELCNLLLGRLLLLLRSRLLLLRALLCLHFCDSRLL